MVKGAKKQPVNHGKPITAFFTKAPRPPASSPTVPSSSQGTPSSGKDSAAMKSQTDSNTRTKNRPASSTESLRRGSVQASIATLGGSETGSSSKAGGLSPESSSLKRARSPDAYLFSSPLTPARPRTPRPSGADKCIDSDIIDTPNPQRKKKARVSTSEAPNRPESILFVPSSQSDEELSAMESEPDIAASIVRESPTTEDASPKSMDIDMDEHKASPHLLASSSWSPSKPTSSRREVATSDVSSTPPSSDLPPMPPTPVALDAASKTAKIIADIKARALAKSMSSPESATLEFNEQLDSSSDEEDIFPAFPIIKKDAPSTKAETPSRPPVRYALRNRISVSPTRGSSSRPLTSRITVDKSPPRISNAGARSKSKPAPDPFAALLKEKKLATKRGHGTDAFQQAEMTASTLDKDDLDDDFDLDDGGDQLDWNAATQAAKNANWLVDKSASPEMGLGAPSSVNLEEGVRKRLFGKGGGKAILGILERDQASKEEAMSSEKSSGIKIWSTADADSAMQVDEDESALQIPGRSPIVHMLNVSLQRKDFSRAAILLNMPLVMSIDESERAMVASCLCRFVSSSGLDMLRDQVTRALESFWGSTMEPISSSISFSHVLEAFCCLGADPSAVASQQWPSSCGGQPRVLDPLHRDKATRNLITLITACARSRRLKVEEIPDILIAVLLLGMDSDASPDVLQDISLTVHEVCQCLPANDLVFNTQLLSRLVGCVQPLEAINKLRFLSFLSSGANHTRRLANLLAYCIVTDKVPSQDLLSDLPCLRDIMEQLVPYSKLSGKLPGKFALHEDTDYVDLGYYVSILAVAVSNVREYVVQERKTKHASASYPASPGKAGEKPKTDLQLLHTALETLHSNIADTRATHLERSRTKAVIKGLTMNIYYQREFWLKNDIEARAKTLAQYFKTKDKL